MSGYEDTFALASRRVMRFGAVFAVLVAVTGGLALVGYTAIRSGVADPTALSTQASVLVLGTIAGLVILVCAVGLLISTVVWIVSAHRLTAGGPGLAGYGGLIACFLLNVSAYVLPGRLPTVTGAAAAEAALRIGGVALLIASVRAVRARVRRATGQPTLAGRPTLVTSDDWDASVWDPEVQRDIERRRKDHP